jgi:hypothetical protein
MTLINLSVGEFDLSRESGIAAWLFGVGGSVSRSKAGAWRAYIAVEWPRFYKNWYWEWLPVK